jgi:hypothetical protein
MYMKARLSAFDDAYKLDLLNETANTKAKKKRNPTEASTIAPMTAFTSMNTLFMGSIIVLRRAVMALQTSSIKPATASMPVETGLLCVFVKKFNASRQSNTKPPV